MTERMPDTPPRMPRARRESPRRLRRNVGLVVMNEDRKVLAGLRAHANGDHAWQLPQGGIEGRERPLLAAYRELKEETGLTRSQLRLVHERKGWTTYWLPEEWTRGRRFGGQTQKWFLFQFLGDGLPDLSRATDREFEALDWVDPAWLQNHVIDFRKQVYADVFTSLGRFLGGVYTPDILSKDVKDSLSSK